MKTFRYIALVIALAIPGTALAARAASTSVAGCCAEGVCCHPGCTHCPHHHAS